MKKSFSLVAAFLSVALLAGCGKVPVRLEVVKWDANQQEEGRQGGSGVKIDYRLVNESEHIVIGIIHELVIEIRHSQPYPRSREETYKVTCGRRETPLLNPYEEREYEDFIEIPWGDEVLGVSGRVLGAENSI